MSVRGQACAYCGLPAANADHVVPRSFKHRHGPIPPELRGTVAACFACNIRKGARALIPPSWESKLPALREAYPNTPWRIWHGDPKEAVFKRVHT